MESRGAKAVQLHNLLRVVLLVLDQEPLLQHLLNHAGVELSVRRVYCFAVSPFPEEGRVWLLEDLEEVGGQLKNLIGAVPLDLGCLLLHVHLFHHCVAPLPLCLDEALGQFADVLGSQ